MSTPIVLLHGWGFTPAVWGPVIDAWVQTSTNHDLVIAPELMLPSGDLSSAIGALIPLMPERAHIVGWSLGGELAMALAQGAPERVASLTMIASTPCFINHDDWALGQPPSLLDDFDQRLDDNPVALLKRFSMLIRHGDVAASRDRALSDLLTQANQTDSSQLRAGLQLLRDIDLRANLSTVATPTLLMHGAYDAVVPLATAEWLAQHTGALLHKIEGASHALPLTHAPQIVGHLHHFVGQNA